MLQMMKGSKALLCGTLAGDPEFVELGSNQTPAVKFSVLAERGNQNAGTPSVFCSCIAWREMCEALRGCQKGDAVLVMATVSERENNNKTYLNYTAEFVTPAIHAADALLSSSEIPATMPEGTQVAEDDDLPF